MMSPCVRSFSKQFGFSRAERTRVAKVIENLVEALAVGSGASSPARPKESQQLVAGAKLIFAELDQANKQGLPPDVAIGKLVDRLITVSLQSLYQAANDHGMAKDQIPAMYRTVFDFASGLDELFKKRAS